MLFVGIGIVILLASFLIALISLLREQEERQDAWSQPVDVSDPTSEQASVEEVPSVVASDEDSSKTVAPDTGDPDLLVSDSVFPWESDEEEMKAEPEVEVTKEPRILSGEISMQAIRDQRTDDYSS